MNGRRASVSTNKVYGIANSSSCSSSYMPTQSITDDLIIKGLLPGSTLFSPLFPVSFILYSYYFKNGQPFRNILFQPNPVHTSTSHFLKIHRNSYRCTVCELRISIVTLHSLLRLILPSGRFPTGFHTKIPYTLLPLP